MIREITQKIEQAKGVRSHIEGEVAQLGGRLAHAEKLLEATLEAQVLIQTTAKETQEQVRYHIQDVVQSALDAVFPMVYDFRVSFEIKRGRTEAQLKLVKDGEEMDAMSSTGGGVVDILAFALRLASWTLSQTDNLIILDEPFKFVSANLRPLCADILRELSKKLELQIMMVTHDEELVSVADRVFEIDQKNRQSFVKKVR